MFFIQVVQDPTCHWLQSVFCVPFSALTVLAWRQEGHLFSKNVCSLSPEVFFLDKWRKSSKGNWLTQVHLQTGCSSGDRHVKKFSTYWSYDSRWRKLIKDVWRTWWVWGGKCFFWYRPTQVQRPFNGLWPGTTRVGRYQKKHLPPHTHHVRQTSFINFLHLLS